VKPRNILAALATIASALLAPAAVAETLTLSSWVPPTHYLQKDIIEPWIADVAKATEGRVTVKILPKPVGSPPQHWELARKGVADITWGNFTYEPDRFKSIWFAELPFVGTSAEASGLALWDTYQKYLSKLPAYEGVVMLGVGMLGGGAINHGSKAIVDTGDLKNQKIRMGGPIQKRLLEDLGAIPVAAPGPKAYELLEGGVIDGSLHPLESVVNFRVDEKLKFHTKIPGGFYDASFFIGINEAKWKKLSQADRDAIMKVSGPALTKRWGARFDQENKTAEAKMRNDKHTFNEPSKALMERITVVRNAMLKDWAAEGASFGLANAKEVADYFDKQYKGYAK
jgi:TRAP-type C4-dicarboxylate transport system substrate-binding protein